MPGISAIVIVLVICAIRINLNENRIGFAELVRAYMRRNKGDVAIGHGIYKPLPDSDRYPSLATAKGKFTPAYGFAAHVAEVEVDTLTGEVRLVQMTAFHDCGFPLNPLIVEGQIDGNVSTGQGQALTEDLIIRDGLVFNPNFIGYGLPTILETPEVIRGEVCSIEPKGPFGAKEVGEGAIAGVLGAVANAVHDAVGVRIKSLPITPEKVLGALERKNG